MSFDNPTTTIPGTGVTGPITGNTVQTAQTAPRIALNDPAYPNQVIVETGLPDENVPAGLEVYNTFGNPFGMRLRGPSTLAEPGAPSIELSMRDGTTRQTFTDTDRFQVNSTDMILNASSSFTINGPNGDGMTLQNRRWQTELAWTVVGDVSDPFAPPFAGNWAVDAVPVGFVLDAVGCVRLRGRATEAVASSTTIFTLPVGYRPPQVASFAIKASSDAGTVGWINVETDGRVNCVTNVTALRGRAFLDAISFLVW